MIGVFDLCQLSVCQSMTWSSKSHSSDKIGSRRTGSKNMKIVLKPIFYWKLCSRWQPNASESDTNNMKSRWPTQNFCIGDPTPPFGLLVLALGLTQILAFAVGVTQILAFLDTNMLV